MKHLTTAIAVIALTAMNAHVSAQSHWEIQTDKQGFISGLNAPAEETAPAAVDNKTDDNSSENNYHFKLPDTPKGITRFCTTVFPYSKGQLYNLRGTAIVQFGGKDVLDVAMNPAGFNLVVVTDAGKGRSKATVYAIGYGSQYQQVFSLNTKKLGFPTSAVYSPDALRLMIATDQGLKILDSRKFKLLDEMPLAHKATKMVASPNGYHLAISDGNKVTVYNLEDKSVRHNWTFESDVTDLLFDDDSAVFAVLTDDGLLSVYDTRTYAIKYSADDLGDGKAASFTTDGKYVAVVKSPDQLTIVNLVDDTDRQNIFVNTGNVNDVVFVPDSRNNTLLSYNSNKSLKVKRMNDLTPYYSKLVNDEVNRRFNEWLKMLPDETLEEYRLRVNDETRERQRRLLEDEISTRLAPDMLSLAEVSLGQYDDHNGLLEVGFDNMPPIYLPVPEGDITAFTDPNTLTFSNAKYSVDANDRFELIYAEIFNSATGKTYVYDNIERAPLNFMQWKDDEKLLTEELVQQQQMEEIALREIQEQVVEEAKSQNVISDHTNISVNTEVIPDYDANGNKILNYQVRFTYEVDPGFTAKEDFGPGKYHIEQSGAGNAMMKIVTQALQGELANYIKEGKKLNVTISGTADSSPIVGRIIYDGVYGDFEDEPVYQNGELKAVSVATKGRIDQNEQLAFLRAMGVKQFLQDNVKELEQMRSSYRTEINVAEGKGSQFRRITAEFTFVDAF